MKTLSLVQVSVTFGAVQALAAVDLTLQAGQVCMLAGPNGAGKSTLLKVLLGLVRPEQGSIQVDGTPREIDKSFKEDIGYLPESVAFSENLTGQQVLRFFARARAVSDARVDEVLARVGLTAAARRAVRGYSRGMRQRLGLGVAILAKPRLLILDEPTGGLDMEGLSVLWSVLEEWRAEQRLVLMSTHDLALLERRVDRMCVLKDGRLLADGTPTSLRQQVSLPLLVQMQLSSQNEVACEALKHAVEDWSEGAVLHSNGVLRISIPSQSLLGLLDLRGQYAEAVQHMRIEEPGLDEVYEKILEES